MTAARQTQRKPDSPLRRNFTAVRSGLLQRKCACGGTPGPTGECEECRKKRLQRKASQPSTFNSQPAAVPPIVHEVLRSPAEPLDAATRAFMEPRFGHDFSHVRVHTDARAAESARAVSALAYTVGRDVVFGAGRYAPGTSGGQRLLTHELVHTIQQRSAHQTAAGVLEISPHMDAAEREAENYWSQSSTGRLLASERPAQHTLARQEDGATEENPDSQPTETTGSTPVLWFVLNSTDLRQDGEVDSVTHLALAIRRAREHLSIAGDAGEIVVHGYASVEGDEAHNVALSQARAERVKALLIEAGIQADKITATGHGPDNSLPGLQWNRRVEIELKPSITYIEMEDVPVQGQVPRSGPRPVEQTSGLTSTHWEMRERPRMPTESIEPWTESESVMMEWERVTSPDGRSASTADYKDRWVRAHRHIIRVAAAEQDVPDWLVGGVAWIEVGGEPPWTDDLSYILGDLGIRGSPERASYGDVAMQIRRAAEELGYDPAALSQIQASFIISSLRDPQQNLLLVAAHLSRLRNIDYPGKPAELLTDDEVRIIATRYNRGPDLTLDEISKNTGYGDMVIRQKNLIQQLLQD